MNVCSRYEGTHTSSRLVNNSSKAGIADLNASWRRERISDAEFMRKMLAKPNTCPLLGLPGVTKKIFRRDWLHGADLGVGADWLGNVFEVLSEAMPGANRKQRCNELWNLIQAYYAENGITDKLLSFKYTTFKQKKAQPKLRGGAAMIRALIPFAEEACHRILDGQNPEHATIIECAKWMHEAYKCLRHDHPTWREHLPYAARMFANNYMALHAQSEGNRWRPKPKLHYFLEMCSDGTKPSTIWTYRDEDFGGGWSLMSHRRGGRRGPSAQSAMALSNWRASQAFPRIL